MAQSQRGQRVCMHIFESPEKVHLFVTLRLHHQALRDEEGASRARGESWSGVCIICFSLTIKCEIYVIKR